MAFLLTKKFTSLRILFPSYRHFSTKTQQKEDVPFIAQYLISSFGFSEERALRVTTNKDFARIKSPEQPESVVRFLKDTGLTDVQVKKAISVQPQILYRKVTCLKPTAKEVIACGFTRETLIQSVVHNPLCLASKNILSGLKFWRNFFASEEAFLKIIKARMLMSTNIDKRIIPRINLLREYGLSDTEIATVLSKTRGILFQKTDCMEQFLEQTEKLGFLRGSKMFLEGLAVVSSLKKDTFDKKVALFKTTYGWSEENMKLALRKFPRMMLLSEEYIRSKMDFLIGNAGLDPRSIASCPILLSFSSERRLIPRHHVLALLKSKGIGKNWTILYTMTMSDKLFVESFILPYKEELPGLEEEFAAACAGKIPLS